ncbi:hypothetical protein DAPPUDRAFT_105260 [Daphnia pulex]|uniref:Uncharacterized protein n=1 Tax=Daphnia pulex TaxID=6669 RepID=E9GPX7_DAPPU|nr:hypothetical protein DAPPUDRAFT_105260 [Daphnia pulex]|eukprot:EFX78463.1 hypothetical protein DAPPUDRAFT_105260 [Daphnia pulex]
MAVTIAITRALRAPIQYRKGLIDGVRRRTGPSATPPQTIVIISDSSDVPSCSGTGAASRVFFAGSTIGVLPKQPPKKGLKHPKERLRWPYTESMEKLMANNPTVTLEHVTDVVDSVKKRGKSKRTENAATSLKTDMVEIKQKRAAALESIANSQLGKNEAMTKIAMAIEALAARK